MARAGLLFLLALGVSDVALAAKPQVGIMPGFSDRDGRQAVFAVQFPDAPPLEPAAVDSATIAAEFKRLCLDTEMDPARIDAAAAQSPLRLTRSTLRFAGDRSTRPFDFDGWHGRSADIRIRAGDPAAFRKLPFYVVDSGVVITGPMKNLPAQCNLDVASTDLADFDRLVAALTAAIGSAPVRAKSSRKWGQASWSAAGPAGASVIGLRIDDLHKPAQRLHLGVVKPNGRGS